MYRLKLKQIACSSNSVFCHQSADTLKKNNRINRSTYFMLNSEYCKFCCRHAESHTSNGKRRIVTELYVIMPLVFVGFICNLLIVIVLGRDKTMNKTTRFLLQMLAIGDIMFYVFLSIANIFFPVLSDVTIQ
jgi:hypothetical protein